MKDLNIPYVSEQVVTCRSLVLAAEHSSQAMDKFVLWMLTAFGAGLTYLLGKDLSRVDNFKIAGFIYLSAVFVTILQRYLAMIIETGAKAFKAGEEIWKGNENADFARYLVIYINSVPLFQRTFIAWIGVQMMNGDIVSTGRVFYRMAMAQVYLGSLSCGLLLWSAKEALQHV